MPKVIEATSLFFLERERGTGGYGILTQTGKKMRDNLYGREWDGIE